MTALNKYEGKSLRELAEMYNSMVSPDKHIKKFPDRDSAIRRMTNLVTNETTTDKRGKIMSDQTKPQTKPKIKKEDAPAAIQQKSPKMAKESSKTTLGQVTLVGRKSQHSGKKIKILAKENPRRAGSHGHKNWSIYKNGMTYEEYILAKGGANHLSHDLAKGFIELI